MAMNIVMCGWCLFQTLDELTKKAVPASIILDRDLDLPEPIGELTLLCLSVRACVYALRGVCVCVCVCVCV